MGVLVHRRRGGLGDGDQARPGRVTQPRIGGELEGVLGADGGGLLARRFEVDHRSIGGDDVVDRVDLDTCDRAAQGTRSSRMGR